MGVSVCVCTTTQAVLVIVVIVTFKNISSFGKRVFSNKRNPGMEILGKLLSAKVRS